MTQVTNRSCSFSSPSTLIIHIGQWYNCSIVHGRSIQRFIPCTLGSHPAQLHFGVFSYIYTQSYAQYPNIWFARPCILQLYSQVISQIIQVGIKVVIKVGIIFYLSKIPTYNSYFKFHLNSHLLLSRSENWSGNYKWEF